MLLSLNTTRVGSFSDSMLHGTGHNDSGYSAPVHDITLIVKAQVRDSGTVPEPGTLALLALALLLLIASTRRSARRTRH